MRAVLGSALGPWDNYAIAPWPCAAPAAGEVQVEVVSAGVTFVDALIASGRHQVKVALPFIPGNEVSGIVVAVGDGVTGFAPGDAVCVMADPFTGTYAQAIVCTADRIVPRPAGLSLHQAAALMQPGNSAWIAVMDTAQVQRGMRVLVHGGSGAVGSLMVQLCRHLGADVSATCRSGNEDYVVGLGAARAISYEHGDFGTLRNQDVVFDLIGGATHARSYPVLRKGGHLVYLVAAPIVDQSAEFGVQVTRAMISDRPQVLAAVASAAEQGIFQPRVAGVFRLADAALAHAALESGQVTRGRLVLDILAEATASA